MSEANGPDGQRRIEDGDLVPKGWADGNEEMTVEEWGQREYDFGRRTGLKEGIAFAAAFVEQCAVAAFTKGNDDEARSLRQLSKRIAAEVKL